MRQRTVATMSVVLALASVSLPTPATAAAATAAATTIPEGTQLTVQGSTPAADATYVELATVNVTTSTPNETRKLRAYLPVEHTRSDADDSPDRFYMNAAVSCPGADAYPSILSIQNLLAEGTLTLAPQMLVSFPTAASYVCKVSYKISTSFVYDDATDDVVLRTGGYIAVADPLLSWVEQCYWPTGLTGVAEDCEIAGEAEAASVAIPFGRSVDRTPLRVSIPAGTTVRVRANAALTTCGGTGGADSSLCGDDLGSFRPSTVRSIIGVDVVGTNDPDCDPALSTDRGFDGRAWLGIPVKVHHGALANDLELITVADPGCPTVYDLVNTLTTTSGEKTISHQNGTVLFVDR